jgi:hypothetical protein
VRHLNDRSTPGFVDLKVIEIRWVKYDSLEVYSFEIWDWEVNGETFSATGMTFSGKEETFHGVCFMSVK